MRIFLSRVILCAMIFSSGASMLPVAATGDFSGHFVTTKLSIIPEDCRIGEADRHRINQALCSTILDKFIYAEAPGQIDKTGPGIILNEYDSGGAIALTDMVSLSLDGDVETVKSPGILVQAESEEIPDAEEESTDDGLNPLTATIGVIAGIALIDEVFEQLAEMQASDPQNWGIVYGLFVVPYGIGLFASEFPESEAAPWIVGGFTAAFAAYLINLDEDKYSEEEISEKIYHATWALLLTTGTALYLFDEKNKKGKSSFMDIHPTPYGGELRLVYRF